MDRAKIILITNILFFIIIDIAVAIGAAERTIFHGMLVGLLPALGIVIPIIFAMNSGLKIIETGEKKKILWKMPLVGFLSALVISIIAEIILILQPYFSECVGEFACTGFIFWPMASLLYMGGVAIFSFIISLILYFIYRA